MIDKGVTAAAALICLGGCVALWVMEKEIPPALWGLTGVLLGRYIPVPGKIKK